MLANGDELPEAGGPSAPGEAERPEPLGVQDEAAVVDGVMPEGAASAAAQLASEEGGAGSSSVIPGSEDTLVLSDVEIHDSIDLAKINNQHAKAQLLEHQQQLLQAEATAALDGSSGALSGAAGPAAAEEAGGKGQAAAASAGQEQEKVLVKQDSGHVGVLEQPGHMEKRIKKLKKLSKNYRELGEPKFLPSDTSAPGGAKETRRIKFADETGRALSETTYTEKLHYPVEVFEEVRSDMPKSTGSCCAIC